MKFGTRCIIIGGFVENIGRQVTVIRLINRYDDHHGSWVLIRPIEKIKMKDTLTNIVFESTQDADCPKKYLMPVEPDSELDVEPIEETRHV